MRKLLLILLVGILAVTAGMIVVKGIETDNFSIDSYMTIAEANNELDDLINQELLYMYAKDNKIDQDEQFRNEMNQASSLKETSYKNKKNQLDSAYKQLVSERESYEELLNLGVDRNGIPLSKIQEYEIEKIWITLGTYAEEQGIDLKLDISVNNSVSKTYDLNFTINGTYTEIEDFIRKVQEDNTLVFKIENFKLVSSGTSTSSGVTDTGSTIMDGIATQSEENQTEETPVDTTPVEETLTATFVCKDIKLNIVENTTTSDSDDNSSTDSTEETTSTTTKTTSTKTTSTKTTSTTTSSN